MANPETGCRCGSGAHPRECELHPELYRLHVAELNAEAHVSGKEAEDAFSELQLAIQGALSIRREIAEGLRAQVDEVIVERNQFITANLAMHEGWIKDATAKTAAYAERNKLVAALSHHYPSHLALHNEADASWDADWRTIVCIHAPVGQLAWHVHDSERPLFEHLVFEANDWDGHTTDEKCARLAKLKHHPLMGERAQYVDRIHELAKQRNQLRERNRELGRLLAFSNNRPMPAEPAEDAQSKPLRIHPVDDEPASGRRVVPKDGES